MFGRVRMRLSAFLVLLFLALYILTSVLIYSLTVQLTIGSVDAVIGATAQPLVAEVSSSFNQGSFPTEFVTLTQLVSLYPKVTVIILRDALGNEIASTNPNIHTNFPFRFPTIRNFQTVTDPAHRVSYRVLTVRIVNPYQQPLAYLQIGLNINHDLSALNLLIHVLWMVAVAGTILAALAGVYMSSLFLRPLVRSWQQQQQFVADASHELRTPLTVIQLNMEVIRSDPERSVAENEEWFQVIDKETGRLRRLTEDLLTLARLDSASLILRKQTVDLYEIVSTVLSVFLQTALNKRIELQLDAPDQSTDFVLQGDHDRLYQMCVILVDNAIKYTNSGKVSVALERKRNSIYLYFRDTGIGISSEHIPHIFDRFYRADEARVRETGGTGLGLSIARFIVEAHKGKISVKSDPDQGSEFMVILPTS